MFLMVSDFKGREEYKDRGAQSNHPLAQKSNHTNRMPVGLK